MKLEVTNKNYYATVVQLWQHFLHWFETCPGITTCDKCFNLAACRGKFCRACGHPRKCHLGACMLMVSSKYWNTETHTVEYHTEKQRCLCDCYVEITEKTSNV